MPLPAGTTFGPYRITAPLGAGGMGEVYKAVDTRLDRSVAIKVLPEHLSANPQLRERFEREARAISAISHPNICTLFDIGREKDTDYLVMEYLEGETLADRLAGGPLPIDQVLRYGIEIAEALEKAHRSGIVHRDLKPGNIMITKSGAKLLDFGLARYARPEEASVGPTLVTAQKPLTQEGTILGTYQYMAPEQLEGDLADARTDIFALGAVLYEMVTGRRAFDGKSRTSLIAAIVAADPPPISTVQPFTPAGLERVVTICLAKNPEDRWATAHDVALELKWIQRERSQPAALAERSRGRRLRRALPWILTLAALATAAVLGIRTFERDETPRQVRFRYSIPDRYVTDIQVSPDGKHVALAVQRRSKIIIRSLDGSENREIDVDNLGPSLLWSPDSASLAFMSDFKLMRMDIGGGPMQTICASDYGVGGVWLADGTIVFTRRFGEGLVRVPAAGGTPEPFTRLDARAGETLHAWARAVPETDLILFLRRTVAAEKNQIFAIATGGGDPVKVTDADALVAVTPRNLYFVRGATLYRQAFDARGRSVLGQPELVTDKVRFSEAWANATASVDSAESTIAYIQPSPRKIALRWFDRAGKAAGELATHEDVDVAKLSPDGRLLATDRHDIRHGADEIWVHDLARGIDTRLTTTPAGDESPTWTPDGRSILFASDLQGFYEPYIVAADGSSPPRRLLANRGGDTQLSDVSPDGKTVLLQVSSPKTSYDIWTASLANPGDAAPWLATDALEVDARFSPDGKWVAYVSVSGGGEIYIRSFPAADRLIQISSGGGQGPRWSPTGREVFYIAKDKLMAVSVTPRADALDPGVPRALFDLPPDHANDNYEPDADGQRFMIAILADGTKPTDIEVVSTWPPGR